MGEKAVKPKLGHLIQIDVLHCRKRDSKAMFKL